MKVSKVIFAACIFAAVLFSGCKTKVDPGTGTGTNTGTGGSSNPTPSTPAPRGSFCYSIKRNKSSVTGFYF